MKVKGTGSRCLLEECVKDNYYARFHPHSYHCCKVMKFIPRLDANCGRTDGRTNERKVEPLYRTLLKAGAIKMQDVRSKHQPMQSTNADRNRASDCRLLPICNQKHCVRPQPTLVNHQDTHLSLPLRMRTFRTINFMSKS